MDNSYNDGLQTRLTECRKGLIFELKSRQECYNYTL